MIIVTGAASGIGQACAGRLLREGARVLAADMNFEAVTRFTQTLGGDDRIRPFSVNVASLAECVAMASRTLEAFGKITGLVHSAGVNQRSIPVVDLEEDEWRRILDVNLGGTFNAIRSVAPHMKSGGAIVTISSGAARVVRAGAAAYCVSKAGVVSLTKVSALELAPKGIRVNSVAPGFIDTEMNRSKFSPERRGVFEQSVPLKKIGEPDEVAAVASFLLSDESSYICGEIIAVDGGVAAASRN